MTSTGDPTTTPPAGGASTAPGTNITLELGEAAAAPVTTAPRPTTPRPTTTLPPATTTTAPATTTTAGA